MPLSRYKDSEAFVLRSDQEDPYTFTAYVPAEDPGPEHAEYASIAEALGDQGLFVQMYRPDVPHDREGLNALVRDLRGWSVQVGRKIAFALMDQADRPVHLVYRDEGWQQQSSPQPWHLSRLAEITLTPVVGDHIGAHADPDRLQLGTFRLDRRQGANVFRRTVTPTLHLGSGRLHFEFGADSSFFQILKVSQPFVAATGLRSNLGGRFISSESLSASIFDTNHLGELDQELHAELDLVPHWRHTSDHHELADRSLRRTGLWIPDAGEDAVSVPLMARDTVGRQLRVRLGKKDQVLRILPVPKLVRHDISDPRLLNIRSSDSFLIPHGRFPVEPAAGDRSIARRFKFGPSNVDMVEVQEKGPAPAVALEFHANVAGKAQAARETGGFFRRTLAPWAKRAGTAREIIRELEHEPPLTSDVDSVWPSFVTVDEGGSPLADAVATDSESLFFSTQPDSFTRYGPRDAVESDAALEYRYEKVEPGSGPIPFTFLEGLPEKPFGKIPVEAPREDDAEDTGEDDAEGTRDAEKRERDSERSDLELLLSKQRFVERPQAKTNDPALLRDVAFDDAPERPNITPQGFEIIADTKFREFVLAQTDKGGKRLDLRVRVMYPPLWQRFQQNSFFLVMPTRDAVDPRHPEIEFPAIDLKASVQLEDWGFDLAFEKEAPPQEDDGGAPVPNNRSVLILKYQKGKLRDLVKNQAEWDNELFLKADWKNGAQSALEAWVDTVDKKKEDRAFAAIRRILDDPKWTGVLMINPVIDIGALPSALKSIVPGIDLEFFRGHHIGFTENKIVTDGSGDPRISKSSLFGLIDYQDQRGFDKSPEKRGEFAFRVERLQVLFANTEVQDFNCLLKVRLPSWFQDTVDKAEGGPKIPRGEDEEDVFGILGRYEAFYDESSPPQKVSRYSFIYDDEIKLVQGDSRVFKKARIDRIELRTTKSDDQACPESDPDCEQQMRLGTELRIDAIIEFREDLGSDFLSDVFGFDKLEISGLAIPFEVLLQKTKGNKWKKAKFDWVPKLKFDGISLGTDPNRRRPDSLLSKFPLKFRTFRFFDAPKPISELGFMDVYTTAAEGLRFNFEYGLEWALDFGSLAKMLGLDSSLEGSLLVGWMPKGKGITVGLRFDDMGGDRLDIGIGSVLRLRAEYFDVFNPKDQGGEDSTFIVATDLLITMFGMTLPPDPKKQKLGLLLAPNPASALDGPLGWLTSIEAEKVAFIEEFSLALGQNLQYVGDKTSPKEIVDEVTELVGTSPFPLDKDLEPKEKLRLSKEYRSKLAQALSYNEANEWFIAFGGAVAKVMSGYALYNPPTLFGGEVGIEDFITIAILYKQETPQLGVYTGTLLLSDSLRSINIGAARIQIPQIQIKIDTDGGFGINVGLNLENPDDFSNAASCEVAIFKGDAGFMYARLHGAALRDIPRLANAAFPEVNGLAVYSPITRVMVALRVGLGREFKKAILKAGASITIYGIFSGSWGKSNLEKLPAPVQAALRDDGLPGHYHKYWGEVGVIAEIYGVVDFGITRARLNARLLVGIGLVFETWHETLAYVRGSLHLSIEWVIARFKIFGKTIEIKITLSFSVEYRQDFVLDAGQQGLYDKWFGGAASDAVLADAMDAIQLDWSATPPQPTDKVEVPLLLTLDLTLADDGTPRLIPLVFLPFADPTPVEGGPDPKHFTSLATLVLDWTLAAAYPTFPAEDQELSLEDLKRLASDAVLRDWHLDRGSWAADPAWDVLLDHFDFSVSNASGSTGGTVLTLRSGFGYEVELPDGSETGTIGEAEVSNQYLEQLDDFFDELRIHVQESVDGAQDDVPAADDSGTRPLIEYLFEEYLESLAKGIWGHFAAAVDRGEWSDAEPAKRATLQRLRAFVRAYAAELSGLVNRQAFSGARVPDDEAPDDRATAALYEKAGLALDVSDWGAKGVRKLTLTHADLDSSTEFDVDDGSSDLDELMGLSPVFGDVRIEQVEPFEVGDGQCHTLAEQVALLENAVPTSTVWTVPEVLAARAYERAGTEPVEVHLEGFLEGESEAPPEIVPYEGCTLLSLPVRPVTGVAGAFEIEQFAEADRRLLHDFMQAGVGATDFTIDFFGEEQGEEGNVARLTRSALDLDKSFLGRVNLAEDPNPTSFGDADSFEAADATELLLRARPVRQEYANFLRLVMKAAKTNSGGYVLHLDGWEDAEASRIWLVLKLGAGADSRELPSYVNRFLTQWRLPADPDALAPPLAVREAKPRVVPVGEPGAFVARVVRERPAPAASAAAALSQRFNLLQVEVEEHGGFSGVPALFDLPTPPETEKGKPNSEYTYNWSIPAHSLVSVAENDLYPGEEDSFLYAAVGKEMKVRAGFRDVLGYSPDGTATFAGRFKGRYFDPLVSVLSLSGLDFGHSVDEQDGSLKLQARFVPASLGGDDTDEERLQSVRAAYSRAMQQVRDGKTRICVESTLGFLGEGQPASSMRDLDAGQRRALYDILKQSRAAVKRPGNGPAAIIEFPPLSFDQAGVVPAEGVARYRVRLHVERDRALVWPEIREIEGSNVVSLASDVPLLRMESKDLASAVRKAFAEDGNPTVRLAYSRDGRNEETFYVVDERVVAVDLAETHSRPAFSAIRPFGRKPYAKAEARIWSWDERKAPPTPQTRLEEWPVTEITGFDQDAAFLDLLRDVDLALSPARAAASWSGGNDAEHIDALLRAKDELAGAMPPRVSSILLEPDDIQSVERSRKALQSNLGNSFRRRLARVGNVDTLLVAPLTYAPLAGPGKYLLYGSVLSPLEDKNTAHFYPAALERDGERAPLVIQFDARQPASREIYELPLSFAIEYVRWDADGDRTPYGSIWLKLFEPVAVPLAREVDGDGGAVKIPVLYKKLLKKPDISFAEPRLAKLTEGMSLADAVAAARKWTFQFDLERSRAATQDDLLVDVDYNTRPEDIQADASAGRDLGEILYEYTVYRGMLETDPSLYLLALASWASQAAEAIGNVADVPVAFDGSLDRKTHELEVREASDGIELEVSLYKRGEWDSSPPLAFEVHDVSAEAEVNTNLRITTNEELFAFRMEEPTTEPGTGEYFAGRRIVVKGLDILTFENAWPSGVIRRNATLGDYSVNEAFVYETDRIRTGNALTPFLDVETAILLPGASIAGALEAVFDEVMRGVEEWPPLVDLRWGYDSGQLDTYKGDDRGMSVFKDDPIGRFVPTKLSGERYADQIGMVEASIQRWEERNGGRPEWGRYVFELRVFSRLDRVEKPLLRLADLRFDLPRS